MAEKRISIINNAHCPKASGLEPSEPLWKRAPTRDADGSRVSDFMMIIPKFKTWPELKADKALKHIQAVFDHYKHAVVFADMNLKLNVLWISVKPIPGICMELTTAIQARVPEAVLVGSQVEMMMGERNRR